MVYQIVLIALSGVLLAAFLKKNGGEYSTLIGLATALVIFFLVIRIFVSLKEELSSISNVFTENSLYFGILFKMIGVAYLCEFCCGICKDAGYQTIGTQVEVFGKIAILLSGIPVLLTLIQTIQNFSM